MKPSLLERAEKLQHESSLTGNFIPVLFIIQGGEKFCYCDFPPKKLFFGLPNTIFSSKPIVALKFFNENELIFGQYPYSGHTLQLHFFLCF